MGVVYKARQKAPNRVVALKMILGGGHACDEGRARFHAEAEAIARLQHPGIVHVFEVGEHAGLPFFSMEFCPGGSLAGRLKGGPLSAGEAAALVEQLARAMQHAHEAGIIHRDLKPVNVLLVEGPEVPAGRWTPKVADFGLAKFLDTDGGHTRSGAVMGTPSYMAPEQAAGRTAEVGLLSDVYALGAILYECLTGRPPFKAATEVETRRQVVDDEPAPPRGLRRGVSRDLEWVCLKCLEKGPARRYASAAALADDLKSFLGGEPVQARPRPLWRRVVRALRPRRSTAALALTLAAGVLGFWLWLWLRQRDREAFESVRAEVRESLTRLEERNHNPLLYDPNALALIRKKLGDHAPLYEKMVRKYPHEPELRVELASVYRRMAWAEAIDGQGDKNSAFSLTEKACAIFTELADSSPDYPDYLICLADTYSGLGVVQSLRKKPGESEAAYREAIRLRQRLAALGAGGSHSHDNSSPIGSASRTFIRRRVGPRRSRRLFNRSRKYNPALATPTPNPSFGWATSSPTPGACRRPTRPTVLPWLSSTSSGSRRSSWACGAPWRSQPRVSGRLPKPVRR